MYYIKPPHILTITYRKNEQKIQFLYNIRLTFNFTINLEYYCLKSIIRYIIFTIKKHFLIRHMKKYPILKENPQLALYSYQCSKQRILMFFKEIFYLPCFISKTATIKT